MFAGCFVGVRCIIAIRSECIHVMFATCSLSVCYIFAMQKYGFCVAKVWFLACKKGVLSVQKGGFCIAKVWFLFFECWVVAIFSQCYHNPFATHLAIRQQHFCNSSAAVGVDLSCSHIWKHPQNDELKCACVEMNIHI